jgi:hypothetical protein
MDMDIKSNKDIFFFILPVESLARAGSRVDRLVELSSSFFTQFFLDRYI